MISQPLQYPMGSYDSGRVSDLGGINISARRGNSLNGIRFDSDRTDPTSSNDVILYRGSGSSLRFWDGSSATTLGSAGGLVNFSLNDAYDDGSTITVDVAAVTLNGVNMDTATLALNADAASSGPILLFTNSGSGNDITGTSTAWAVSAAGAGTFATLAATSLTSATNLALEGTGAGTIAIGGTSSGTITLGAGGGSVVVTNGLTITGSADANKLTITAGDMLMSNGKIAVTNDDTDIALTITANSVTTGSVVDVTANGVTSGAIFRTVTTEAGGFTGDHFRATEDGSTVFNVSVDGKTTIAGTAAGTVALQLTLGDFLLEDSDSSKIESEDGTGTLLTLDNKLGAVGNNSAVLLVDAGGAVASGGNALRVIFSGTADAGAILAEFLPDAGSLGIKVDAGGVATAEALYVDSDSTANSIAFVHSDAVIANNKALLELDHATGASAAGSNLLRIVEAASPNAGAMLIEVAAAAADCAALYIDSGSATNNAIEITGAGALATGKAMFKLANTGTPAAADSYLVNFDYSGATMTNNPVAMILKAGGTTAQALEITHTGAGANNKGVLSVTTSGATGAGGSVLRVTGTGTPAAATSYLVDFDNSGATMTNNPVAVFINGGTSTAAALQINGGGASAANEGLLELKSAATGAVGAVMLFSHRPSDNTEANSDVIARLLFDGQDDANAVESYAKIDVRIKDVAAANPDGEMLFYTDTAGTLALKLELDADIVGIIVGDGAATAIVQSSGNFDLTLKTGNATSGDITITDGANANITVTPNGSGKIDLANAVLMSKTESIGAGTGGAIDTVSSISELATDGAGDAYQLADGTEGQLKFIILKTDGGGDAVITPANPGGYSTITMADAGDSVTLLFTNGKWYAVGQGGLSTGPVIA